MSDIGKKRISDHYADQWSARRAFREFIQNNPVADRARMVHGLPFARLFEEIRASGSNHSLSVYDAACGWGDIMYELLSAPAPAQLRYLGADINPSVLDITPLSGATLIQWDISRPIPDGGQFDCVICRAALHHTPDPEETLRSLVSHLKPSGKIVISVYAKKAPMREATDDIFRQTIVPLANADAWEFARQFSKLGRDLRNNLSKITIEEDLPGLGIKSGEYGVQEFIYDHFIKCWYNEEWGLEHSDIVNFDWYHPPYAYRYNVCELEEMFANVGLSVTYKAMSKAQIYFEGKRLEA